MKVNMRELNWAIQRMRKIAKVWQKLDTPDREFLLRKFRDERPLEFSKIASEVTR